MKKLIVIGAAALGLSLASAAPANAWGWPWGVLGFVGVNFGVTQGQLVVCYGKPDLSGPGIVRSLIPIVGPYEAFKFCQAQNAAKR